MDLTGQGRNGELTQTFTDMCMAGTYTCTPVNDVGQGTQAQVTVSLTGKYYTYVIMDILQLMVHVFNVFIIIYC